jgi:hypothetical protein
MKSDEKKINIDVQFEGVQANRAWNAILDRASEKLLRIFEDETRQVINQKVDEFVTNKVTEVIEDTLNGDVPADDLGQEMISVQALIVREAKAFLGQKVDSNGKKTDSCGYGRSSTMAEYLLKIRVDEHFRKHIEKDIAKIVEEIRESLRTKTKKSVTEKITREIMRKIGIDL